jgi:hypothetical protein
MRRVRLLSKLVAGALALLPPAALAQEGVGDVVYVPTPQIVVEEMLDMAGVGPGDFVIDLGSGDGRIIVTAASRHGARGIGVDLDRVLIERANESAHKAGVSDRVQFVEENLFTTDLGRATVVTTYLLPEMNLKLRPTLLSLRPGTRVVAHDYAMGDWYPDEEKTLIVPEKVVGDPGRSYIFFWIVPAGVEGAWEAELAVGARSVPYRFRFTQHFQMVHGTVQVDGRETRLPQFRMKGEALAFDLDALIGDAVVRHRFEGRVSGDAIEGTVTLGDGAGGRIMPWRASRTSTGAAHTGPGVVRAAAVAP